MNVQPPIAHGPQGPVPMLRAAQAWYRGPSRAPGIVGIVLGTLGVMLALVVLVLPYFGFILGGGGDTDAFGEMAAGFARVALGIFIVSAVVLTTGIVLTRRANRHRRAHWNGLQGLPPAQPS